MLIYVMVGILVVGVGVGIALMVLKQDKRDATRKASQDASDAPASLDKVVVQKGKLEWQEIQNHVRLDELLAVEGTTLGGDSFQVILALGAKSHAEVIYIRVGRLIQRVPSGQSGIVRIKQGEALRIMPGEASLSLEMQTRSVERPFELLGDSGTPVVVGFVNSLAEGISIRYAARCVDMTHRFIKSWDLPSAQSDEAILARVSSVADIATLAEKVKDIQTASAFLARHGVPVPLESGVCYILGSAGGKDLSFILLSEVALLIVPVFSPDLNLAQFLENLSVKSQMHARLVLRETCSAVASQGADGRYDLQSLSERNVLLGITNDQGNHVDVVRIEQDGKVHNLVNLRSCESPEYRNVLVWLLPENDANAVVPLSSRTS